jgi:DNA polymerase elongation subunit (family B)
MSKKQKSSQGRKWSNQEDQVLKDFYLSPPNRYSPVLTIAETKKKLAEYGFNRSQDAVRNRIYTLRRKYWMGAHQRRQSWLTGARFGYMDIETVSGFAANFGNMVSWAMYIPNDSYEYNARWLNEQDTRYQEQKMGVEDVEKEGEVIYDAIKRSEAIDWKKFDKRITRNFIRALDKVDIVVTYWGTGFDVKYLRSRAMYWGLRFPKYQEKLHLDLYYANKNLTKMGRNSLQQITQFLGIEGKNHVIPEYWNRARVGDPEAMEYIIDHNIEDVKILARLHRELSGYRPVPKRSL